MNASLVPDQLRLSKNGETLVVVYGVENYPMSAEYLRVLSPSAEVRGHGEKPWATVGGKKQVTIRGIEPVGQYAVKLQFSDGHHTGIYTWDILHDLAMNQSQYWQQYLQALKEKGQSRESL